MEFPMNKLSMRAALAALLLAATSIVSANQEPYPLQYWALRSALSNVEISPDGKRVALMKIEARDSNPVLEIYDAAKLAAGKEQKPFRVNADPMEITTYGWVSDTDIVLSLRQKVRDRIEGFNQGVYETRLAKLDVENEKIRQFNDGGNIVNILPDAPNKIIISTSDANKLSKVPRQFRPLNYYELDLKRGTRKLLVRGSPERGQIEFDGKGKPWISRGFDAGKGEFVWFHRKEGKGWQEIYRLDENSFERFRVSGFDVNNPNTLFVVATNGSNTQGVWQFDVDKKTFGEMIFRRDDVDVGGIVKHSNSWTYPDTVIAAGYSKDKPYRRYFDDVEEATMAQLEQLVPNAYTVRISSRSRDGQALTFTNRGPRDPASFYLLKDQRVVKLGSSQPLLQPEKLADVKYITYPARDGREIPGFVTVPNGEGPFPLIVLPHGGPFVGETVTYDEWSQLLANNGYMVLQPQYRGSQGYGRDFYEIAFNAGGQGGYKMQDDKDDGALYLIEQGMVDPDRVAMFGWSYGGYAALVAASRTPQIYQCVIAGAAVADNLQQVNYYRDRIRGSSAIEQLGFWDDSISPIKEVDKVNVPMLMIHGDVDQRVPPIHARKYIKAMEAAKKPFKMVWLEGADHFSNTLFYDHQIMLYESMIEYLQNDCGPNGL